MCRFFAYWGTESRNLNYWLVEAENSLLQQSRNDESNRPNPDGWGFAFRNNGQIYLVKKVVPAYEDEDFIISAQELRGEMAFAHVRRKSQGDTKVHNTHPFLHEEWLFMHNGNIPNFPRCKQELTQLLHGNDQIFTKGATDSEFLFKYFIYWFRKKKSCDADCILSIINEILVHIIAITPQKDFPQLALNFLLSNGHYLIGFRLHRGLYFLQEKDAVYIASEPIDRAHHWKEVPENHFLICQSPTQLELKSREEVIPREHLLTV